MAVSFSDLDLTSQGLDEEYEKMIDRILTDPAQYRSRIRVNGTNYVLTLLVGKAIDPGSFLALRTKYKAKGWDDLVMNSGESISLIKAIA